MDITADDLDWEQRSEDTTFYNHALCGSVAGCVEHIVMFPFDTLKTNLQALSSKSKRAGVSQTYRMITKNEGIPALFRGVQVMATGSIPAHIAYFGMYEWSCRYLGMHDGKHDWLKACLTGGLSSLCHDCILTPIDVIKQRLQLGCFANTTDCVRSTIRNEGMRAFVRSLPTTLLMNIPFGAVHVAGNEAMKRILYGKTIVKWSNIHFYFISAGLSAALAAAVTNPLDVMKTRLQTQDLLIRGQKALPTKYMPRYVNFKSTLVAVWDEGGIAAFFRGSIPRMAVSAPSGAICWGTYETMKHLMKGF